MGQLNSARVSDARLEHLKGLTALKILGLDRTAVTNEGVTDLQRRCRHPDPPLNAHP